MNDEARAACEQALIIYKKLVNDNPTLNDDVTVSDYHKYLASTHNDFGLLLKGIGKLDQSRTTYQQAILIYKKLADNDPNDCGYQSDLASTHNNLGNLLADMGKPVEALVEFRNAIQIRKEFLYDDTDYHAMSCLHALIGKVATIPLSGIPIGEAKTNLDKAMWWLQKEVDSGYRDVAHMQVDSDLDPLRDRADFQLLIRDLMFPAEPFVP